MSDFDRIAMIVGSRRYARDLIEATGPTFTRPWWGPHRNNFWTYDEQNALIRARRAKGHAK